MKNSTTSSQLLLKAESSLWRGDGDQKDGGWGAEATLHINGITQGARVPGFQPDSQSGHQCLPQPKGSHSSWETPSLRVDKPAPGHFHQPPQGTYTAGGHLAPGVSSVNEALTLAVNLLSNLKASAGSAVVLKGSDSRAALGISQSPVGRAQFSRCGRGPARGWVKGPR